MFQKTLAICGAAALVLSLSVTPAVAAPSDGNGNKAVVDEVFGPFPIGCGDVEVLIEFQAQFRERDKGKNVFLATFSSTLVYSNGNGETWRFLDRGADRASLVDGVVHVSVTGRSGIGNIGHLILRDPGPDQEVIFQRGQAIDPDAEACERLA